MNISYVKKNIEQISYNDLIKLIVDMILEENSRIEDYSSSRVYFIGDRIYREETGTHCVYECIVNNTTGSFNRNAWVPLYRIYNGPSITFNSIRIREEVYTPTTAVSNYTIKLDYDTNQTSVAIYQGMKRLVRTVDFGLNGKQISFTTPLTANQRIIIELRERLGIIANNIIGIVLYDKDNNPYNVVITDTGVVQVMRIQDKDEIRDVKKATIMYGDTKYYLMIDNSKAKPMLGLFEDVRRYIKAKDGKTYSVSATGLNLTLQEEPDVEDGVKYIMGTDKKFYEFSVSSGRLVPSASTQSFKLEDFTVGLTLKSTDNKDVMVDVVNGTMRVIEYLPNIAFNNIRLRSKMNSKVYSIKLKDDNLNLEIDDSVNNTQTYSDIYNELYFYDYNLNNWKLYIDEKNRLSYETCSEVKVRDSRGINMVSDNGILCKLMVSADSRIDVIKYLNFTKMGTFTAPLKNGFVINHKGALKTITVNPTATRMVLGDNDGGVFKTNDHYIIGTDDKLYKFDIDINANIIINPCDLNEFILENKKQRVIIRQNEMINIVDGVANIIKITPVSTITHRIKASDNSKYLLEVIGDRGNEFIQMSLIGSTHKYANLGSGYMFIKGTNGKYYKGEVVSNQLRFTEVQKDNLINYNITNILFTNRGWFKLNYNGTTVSLEKIFNNIYAEALCYESNRDFILESEAGNKFSVSANGNGDMEISRVTNLNNKYVMIRSSNDKVYSIGVENNAVVTYPSTIEKNVAINKVIYLKDTVTSRYNMLYMENNILRLSAISTAPTSSVTGLYVYNKYDEKFVIISANNQLVLVKDILDRITDKNGKKYKMNVSNNSITFTLDTATSSSLVSGPLKLFDMVTNVNYKCYYQDGTILYERTSDVFESKTQAIRTTDGSIYILSLFENRIAMSKVEGTVSEARVMRSIKTVELPYEELDDDMVVYGNIKNSKNSTITNDFVMRNEKETVILEGIDEETAVTNI